MTTGSRTLKDAINDAYRDWVASVETTNYIFGTAAGPAPVPGDGARLPEDHRRRGARAGARPEPAGCPMPSSPASAAARTRSASSTPSSTTPTSKLYGVEAAGDGVDTDAPRRIHRARPPRRAARRAQLPAAGRGRPDHRVALDLGGPRLPGRRPRALLARRRSGAPSTSRRPTTEAMEALRLLVRTEGIIPAIESAHALAGALRIGRELGPDAIIAGQPLGPRRQGHGHRRAVLRAVRRAARSRRDAVTRPRARAEL